MVETSINLLFDGVFRLVLLSLGVRLLVIPFLPASIRKAFVELGLSVREQIKDGLKKITFQEENHNFTDTLLNEIVMPFTTLFVASSFLFSYTEQIYPVMPALAIFTGFVSISVFAFAIPTVDEISNLFNSTDPLEQVEFAFKFIGALLIIKLISLPIWIGIALSFFKIPKTKENVMLDL